MATVSWNIDGSGLWTTAGDWSTGTVPVATDDIILDRSSIYTVTLNISTTVNSITISNTHAALAINAPGGTVSLTGAVGPPTGIAFDNSGEVDVDYLTGSGGTTVTIGGTLGNEATGLIRIGSNTQSAPTTVTANALSNAGTIALTGGSRGNTTDQTTLDIMAAAPTILTGTITLLQDALLEFSSGSIATIGAGAVLALTGRQTQVAISGSLGSNSALSGLTNNAGIFNLVSGAAVTTSAGIDLTNSGTLNVDKFGGGGSSLTIGGTLTNSGTVTIGAPVYGSATSMVAAGLVNTGTINMAVGGPGTFTVNGAVSNSGTVTIGPFADFVATGAVSGGGTIRIGGNGAVAEFAAAVASGQVVNFTSPTGRVALDAPSQFAATIGGVSVTTSTAPVNANEIDLTKIPSGSIIGARLNTSSDVLTVTTSSSGIITLQLSGSYAPGTVVDWVADGGSGTDLFLSTVAPGGLVAVNYAGIGNVPLAWSVQGAADFTGDGIGDILWRNGSTGDVALWDFATGGSFTYHGLSGASSDWSIQATADFDGDGIADVLWRNSMTGDVALWDLNAGGSFSYWGLSGASADWSIQGAADFDGDGTADILWRNTTTGDAALWNMNTAGGFTYQGLSSASADWSIQAAADFSGSGKASILWRNTTTGDIALWSVTTGGIVFQGLGNASADWTIQGASDFNGDGRADILWRNTTTGDVAFWLTGAGTNAYIFEDVGPVGSDWSIQTKAAADFAGTGRADVLWRNTSNGDVALWLTKLAGQPAAPLPGLTPPHA